MAFSFASQRYLLKIMRVLPAIPVTRMRLSRTAVNKNEDHTTDRIVPCARFGTGTPVEKRPGHLSGGKAGCQAGVASEGAGRCAAIGLELSPPRSRAAGILLVAANGSAFRHGLLPGMELTLIPTHFAVASARKREEYEVLKNG